MNVRNTYVMCIPFLAIRIFYNKRLKIILEEHDWDRIMPSFLSELKIKSIIPAWWPGTTNDDLYLAKVCKFDWFIVWFSASLTHLKKDIQQAWKCTKDLNLNSINSNNQKAEW